MTDSEIMDMQSCRIDELMEIIDAMTARVNYIATYQAQVMDGSTIHQNLSLNGIEEGTSPDAIIEAVFHRAAAELAVKGLAVTSVIVLNLSRVW